MTTQNVPCDTNDVFFKKLTALDMGPIAFKLMYPDEGCGWTRSQTTRAIARYMMFLFLIYLYPNSQVVPTPEIDAVWHYHILDTHKYASDCQMLFCRFVHHFPYLGLRGEADKHKWNAAFTDTQTRFERLFRTDTLALNDEESKKPARCQPLGEPKETRPSVDIQADVLKVFYSRLE